MMGAKNQSKKWATLASVLIWSLGLFLAFVIKGGTTYFWLPDFFLLFGFVPFLWAFKQHWFTLLFGLCNCFIGMFLLVLEYLPPEKFTGQTGAMREHLLTMHSAYTWLIAGVLATVWGLIACLIWCVAYFRKKLKKV